MRIILAIFGLVVSPLITVAAAQAVPPPLFDLSGMWELTEYGALRQGKNAIVEITHSGNTVAGVFVRGSECFNGQARPDAFLGQLGPIQPGFPPFAKLSAPAMWVCSNDPALVAKCGGPIAAIYKTKIKEATAELDFIQGTRVTQGVNGCSLDPSEDGIADFSLRRLTPCELEQRIFDDAEADLVSVLSAVMGRTDLFRAAIDAARQRFPDGYRNRSTSALEYPYEKVAALQGDAVDAENFFTAMPAMLQSRGWQDARAMAAELGLLAEPPLIEARDMLEQMNVLEQQLAPEAQRILNEFKSARVALVKCLEQQR